MSASHAARALMCTVVGLSLAPFAPAQSLIASGHGNGLGSPLGLDDVEITPNQQFAVMRENNTLSSFRVYDLTTGALVASGASPSGELMGACLDGIAVTNTRAVVLAENTLILDLTNLANPILLDAPTGFWPRDVEITPDGTIAAVRGGTTTGPTQPGLFLFNLSAGSLLTSAPGNTTPFPNPPLNSWNVDAVAVSNQHAVFLSRSPTSASRTRVTIFTLHPTLGTVPLLTFQTTDATDLSGAPHDVSMSPDGLHAAVRAELSVAVFDLSNHDVPAMAFAKRLFENPGPFQDSAMDSVEITNDRIVTLSKVTNPTLAPGTQVDFFDMSGTQRFDRFPGDPHDLVITPDGTKVVAHSSEGVSLYDVTSLGAGPALPRLDFEAAPSAGTFYFGGLDSVATTNRVAITLEQSDTLTDTIVHFWLIAAGGLELVATRTLVDSRPIDLALTADLAKVAVAGNAGVAIFHVETGQQVFDHHEVPENPFYQWCDGVVASANKIAAIGQNGPQEGWFVLADATPISTSYCTSAPNSSGLAARIRALGDASVTNNNLKLFAEGAPALTRGRFQYGTGQQQVPFGNGTLCVGGSAIVLPRVVTTNIAGAGFLPVNYFNQSVPAFVIQPSSTWHFQFTFLDPAGGGSGFDSSDALTITFAP